MTAQKFAARAVGLVLLAGLVPALTQPSVLPASATSLAVPDTAAPARSSASRTLPQSTAKFRVVDHNIQRKSTALRTAIRRATTTKANLITLQEVCWWQVDQLRRAHPDWSISWKPDQKSGWCRRSDPDSILPSATKDGDGNVAIWTGGDGAKPYTYTFAHQLESSRSQGLVCLTWRHAGVRRRTCSVHLISGSEGRRQHVRTQQAREVYRLTSRWSRSGDLVVIGGDFNASPHKPPLDFLYTFRGRGVFREATPQRTGRNGDCRCSKATFDGGRTKIDYVFFSANRMSSLARRQLRLVNTPSDHHMLVGWAYLDLRRVVAR